MSPSKNVSRFIAVALAALTIPALSLSASTMAAAVTTCPDGWEQVNSIAIDGIFCDRLATADGSFTVPDGIDEIHILAVAGGGGGGAGGKTTILVAGGGGGAGGINGDFFNVVAGDTINYTVGQGGTAGAFTVLGGATSGGNGTDSTVSIGAGAAILVAEGGGGGVAGEDGGTGGASGAYYGTSNAGGAGSSSNPAAGGGGGGWLTTGVAGTEGAIEKGGNGGTGLGVQEYPDISHPTHNAFPNDSLNWNTNGIPDPMFLDRMGYGGGGGVVVDSGMDCSGEAEQFFGYSIPNENMTISQVGKGSCAIQGVEDYAGALAVTAIYAGTGGSGAAGTPTDSWGQPTDGYDGFVYFRIFVPSNTGENPDCDEDTHEFYDVVGDNMQFTEICDLSGVVNDVGLNDESQDDGFDDFGYLNGYNPGLDDPTVNGESFAIRSSRILSNEDGVLGWVAEDVFSVSEQALVDVYYTLTIIENTATWSFEIVEAGTDTPATMDIYIDGGLGSDEDTVWSSTNSSSMYSNDGYVEDPILVWKTNGTWESVVQGEDSLRAEWTNSSAGSVNVIAAGYSCGTTAQLNAHAQSILSNFETKKNTVIPVYSQGCGTALASTGVSDNVLTAGLAGGVAALLGGVLLVAARRRHALIES